MHTDISARKHAEESLRQAYERLRESQAQMVQSEKMAGLGRMAAGIAHEVTTPLATIMSAVEVLQDRLARGEFTDNTTRPSVSDLLDMIAAAVERGQVIIRDLLGFSRKDAEEVVMVDLSAVLKNALRVLCNDKRTAARQIILTAEPINVEGAWPQDGWGVQAALEQWPFPKAVVQGRPSQLEQVFLNLLLNAPDATVDNGIVVVTCRACDNGFEIAVGDRGDGILPENLPYVFEPFFTTKPRGKGTGLGLFVSYQIVSSVGGHIRAESRPGCGTVFRVWLPAATGGNR